MTPMRLEERTGFKGMVLQRCLPGVSLSLFPPSLSLRYSSLPARGLPPRSFDRFSRSLLDRLINERFPFSSRLSRGLFPKPIRYLAHVPRTFLIDSTRFSVPANERFNSDFDSTVISSYRLSYSNKPSLSHFFFFQEVHCNFYSD